MGKASTKAKNKYNATAYDQISIKPPKGTKSEWQAEAEKQGENLTEYITNAVKMRMEADRKREEDDLLADFYSQDISLLEKGASPDFMKLIRAGGKHLKLAFQIKNIGDVELFLRTCGNIDDVYKKAMFDVEQQEEIDTFIRAYKNKRKKALEDAECKLVPIPAEEKINKLLSVPISEINLRLRTINTLMRKGINSIGDFKEFTQNHKLSEIRNCFKDNAIEIIDKIKQYEHNYNVSLNIDYDNLMEQIETLPDYYKRK